MTGSGQGEGNGAAAVYRAPMRARSIDTDQVEGAIHGVGKSLVGIGEPLPEPPASTSEAILSTTAEHGEKAGRMLARFADLPESSLLWTQTGEAEFRLGELHGSWRYDDSAEARRTGIHNVRPTLWLAKPFDLRSTPPGVIDSFARGGKNLQRINESEAERLSRELWAEAIAP